MNTEHEQGTYVRTTHHHNGYYAGDFSRRPLASESQLRQLLHLGVPASVGMPW